MLETYPMKPVHNVVLFKNLCAKMLHALFILLYVDLLLPVISPPLVMLILFSKPLQEK
jgi:hypothetical protein